MLFRSDTCRKELQNISPKRRGSQGSCTSVRTHGIYFVTAKIYASNIERSRERNVHVLKQCFVAWKGKHDHVEQNKLVDWDLALLRQQEAVTLEARINIDARFRSCKKSDWKRWIKEQLDQKIQQTNHASNGDLFSILQPKKLIAKHAGKLTKPLPGYRSLDGQWKLDRKSVV